MPQNVEENETQARLLRMQLEYCRVVNGGVPSTNPGVPGMGGRPSPSSVGASSSEAIRRNVEMARHNASSWRAGACPQAHPPLGKIHLGYSKIQFKKPPHTLLRDAPPEPTTRRTRCTVRAVYHYLSLGNSGRRSPGRIKTDEAKSPRDTRPAQNALEISAPVRRSWV